MTLGGPLRALTLPALAVAALFPVAAARRAPTGAPRWASPEKIQSNDNRTAAGVLRGGVLSVRLEVRRGMWHPDGDENPGVEMLALAEEGRTPQLPGPLIRVPEGTEIRATIRNPLPSSTLTIHGLYTRSTRDDKTADTTVRVAPGEAREVRFRAGAAGTYYYWATTDTLTRVVFDTTAGQLVGALIVDPPNARPTRDRILVLGGWVQSLDASRGFPTAVVWHINGMSWPHTERLTYAVGDSVRLRIINATPAVHPIHLHGFYFRVDSRGDGERDSIYTSDTERQWEFTERFRGASTLSLTWVPERAGNWLFHCHIVSHFGPRPLLGTARNAPPDSVPHYRNHAIEGMSGLVLGFDIRPRVGAATPSREPARRRLRLVVRTDSGGTPAEPAYGYTLQQDASPPAPDAGLLPGPTIVVHRGEPVSITVVNQLTEPTSVHWHGIELESYFDGVPGFSGQSTQISPVIEPRDSFEVRFTPPRSGTFIYHTHAHELRQLRAGLSGALLVLEAGQRYDPATDIPVLITTPRNAADNAKVLINGSLSPAPLEWRVGNTYRLRFINIHSFRASLRGLLVADSALTTWRAVAKDGINLDTTSATARPAQQQVSVGETYDFEFTPRAAGALKLEVRAANGPLLGVQPIRVR
jgi:FtsP/CotA-like multicopper oxidase with cupredoxin domain